MYLLLVEDNEVLAKGLMYSLEKNKFKVVHFYGVKGVKEYIEENHTDLVILDILLADGNGFDLYKNLIRPKNIPTIFLTAKDDENDIVKGLELGAEDYITKPFSTKELIARIKKILMRSKKQSEIKVKDITFDINKMTIYKGNTQIELTSLELKILNLLFLNINNIVTRDMILDKILEWTGNFVDDHTVTVYLKRIREKLGTDIIKTIKGIGYRIDDEK